MFTCDCIACVQNYPKLRERDMKRNYDFIKSMHQTINSEILSIFNRKFGKISIQLYKCCRRNIIRMFESNVCRWDSIDW